MTSDAQDRLNRNPHAIEAIRQGDADLERGAVVNAKHCRQCGRVWRTYVEKPCDRPGECGECELTARVANMPKGMHVDVDFDDVDEVVSYSCPHGTGYDWLCRGCGSKVGGWGIGAAGFGELCGCEVPA